MLAAGKCSGEGTELAKGQKVPEFGCYELGDADSCSSLGDELAAYECACTLGDPALGGGGLLGPRGGDDSRVPLGSILRGLRLAASRTTMHSFCSWLRDPRSKKIRSAVESPRCSQEVAVASDGHRALEGEVRDSS